MKKITREWLFKHGACSEKRVRFEQVFGVSCPVSMASAMKWKKAGGTISDFEWLIRRVLPVLFENKRRIFTELYRYVVKRGRYNIYSSFSAWDIEDRIVRYRLNRIMEAAVQIVGKA